MPNGEVVASVLLLDAALGSYYHSAGASETGYSCGAPTLLVDQIIQKLVLEGKLLFNLGGATTSQSGLLRFKQGFGGAKVALNTTTIDLRTPWRRGVGAAIEITRRLFRID